MEAICLRLCDKFTQPRKEPGPGGRVLYTSRWKLVLSAYNGIRARLLNSDLLEDTNLVLFNINETTLTRWYKDSVRRDEVKTLIQGLQLPKEVFGTAEELPPVRVRPTSPGPPPDCPLVIQEPVDTTGQAKVRNSVASQSAPPSTSLVMLDSSTPTTHVSRTTEWRRRKAAAAGKQPQGVYEQQTNKPPRKQYGCRVCGKAMSSPGHTQFRGQRYCPDAPNQIPREQWLAQKKAESLAKAKAKE